MAQGEVNAPARVPGRRWRIAWLLGLGVLVNYFDRVNLSVSYESLYASFGISTVVFGYLSSFYNWPYCACQLPIGVVLDKFGVRRVGRVSTFLWSVASFLAAIAPGVPFLFGARFLLGIGESPAFPANAKAIGHWFPARERSFPTAIFDSAAKFSSAIGVPLLGIILIAIGWRWSFAATGLISLAYFFIFWIVYREPHEDTKLTEIERNHIESHDAAHPPSDATQSTPLLRLMGRRKVLGLAIGFGSYNYVFYLLLTWLPSYLALQLHIDLLHSFLYTGVPWLIATVAELAIGGWLVDALIRRGWNPNSVRKTVLIGGMACGLGIFGAAHPSSAGEALAWISLSISGLSVAAPVGWAVPSLIARKPDVGKIGGIMNFSNQISGISAPIITGYVVHAYHSFALAFVIPAIYLLIGITAYIVMLGRIEQMDAPAPGVG